jgi:acetoin utilization protein AcuB
MLIRDVMQSNVVTVAVDIPLSTAAGLMSRHRIRHLPVVAGDRLLGIISDRDLKASAASLAADRRRMIPNGPEPSLTAGDLLRPGTVTVGPTAPVEHAASVMAEHRIGSLPVVADGRLVGLVTATDLLAYFGRGSRACDGGAGA